MCRVLRLKNVNRLRAKYVGAASLASAGKVNTLGLRARFPIKYFLEVVCVLALSKKRKLFCWESIRDGTSKAAFVCVCSRFQDDS